MGLFILFGSIVGLGIILVLIGWHVKGLKGETISNIGKVLLVIGLATVISLALIAAANSGDNEREAAWKVADEYDLLMYKQETEKDNQSYKLRVQAYNIRVEKERRGLNNPWTNWYYNQYIAELPLIELD